MVTKLLLIVAYFFLFKSCLYLSLCIGILAVLSWVFSEDCTVLINYLLPKKRYTQKFEDFSRDFLEDLQIVKFQKNNVKYIEKEAFVNTTNNKTEDDKLVIPSYILDRNSRKRSLEYLIKATTRNIISCITVKKKKSCFITDESGHYIYLFYISYKTKLAKGFALRNAHQIAELEQKIREKYFVNLENYPKLSIAKLKPVQSTDCVTLTQYKDHTKKLNSYFNKIMKFLPIRTSMELIDFLKK